MSKFGGLYRIWSREEKENRKLNCVKNVFVFLRNFFLPCVKNRRNTKMYLVSQNEKHFFLPRNKKKNLLRRIFYFHVQNRTKQFFSGKKYTFSKVGNIWLNFFFYLTCKFLTFTNKNIFLFQGKNFCKTFLENFFVNVYTFLNFFLNKNYVRTFIFSGETCFFHELNQVT